LPVSIVSQPFWMDCLKGGTGMRRLMKTSEAWSSNLASLSHSMRMSCGVRTVKRAWPELTTARGSATGFGAEFAGAWAAAENENAEPKRIEIARMRMSAGQVVKNRI
jgi:hypothetical protein